MSEQFSAMFQIGGHANSLGRSGEVFEVVLTDQSRLDELFACISHEDAWVRMRAIDTFEKVARVHPEWIRPYADRLLHDVAQDPQPSIQWHLAELFAEMELTTEQRAEAIVIMKRNIATTDVDWIVAANTMKTLVRFAGQGYIAKDEVSKLLKVQQGHHSKSVVRKATQLLEEITDLKR